MEGRPCAMGPDAGAHCGPARKVRDRHLHAGQQRGDPALHPAIVRGAVRRSGQRHRTPRRAGPEHNLRPARPPRHRCRPPAKPRIQLALRHPPSGLEKRPVPRPRRPDRRGARAAIRQNRRAPGRGVFSRPPAPRFGHGAEQPARLARFRHLARGRAARHCTAPPHTRGKTASRRSQYRASFRCRAHVFCHHPARGSDLVDARPARHTIAARLALHG